MLSPSVEPRIVPIIRNATARWQAIEHLVDRLHKLVRANVHVDTSGHVETGAVRQMRLQTAARLEKELDQLTQDVEGEVDRLTADLLRADLRAQQRKDASREDQ